MPQFHETQFGHRFFEGQLPALIRALTKLGEKQTACNVLAAGALAGNECITADGASRIAIETYEIIERKLKCTS